MLTGVELKDLIVLAAGLILGFAMDRHFFKKQAHADEASERNLFLLLGEHYDQLMRIGIRDGQILQTINRMELEAAKVTDLLELKSQMEQVVDSLEQLKSSELPSDLVFRYKALGDRWSELASIKFDLQVLNTAGQISFERFRIAHKTIFPENYPWAGELRNEHVYIVDTLGTVARIIDLAETETKMSTIAPEKIEYNLLQLFDHWNSNISIYKTSNPDTKISEVAHFHHELEIIHPFTDGNGRLGRMILEEQLTLLFGMHLKFRPDKEDYYRALRTLDLGSPDQLIALIREELGKFNVAL